MCTQTCAPLTNYTYYLPFSREGAREDTRLGLTLVRAKLLQSNIKVSYNNNCPPWREEIQ